LRLTAVRRLQRVRDVGDDEWRRRGIAPIAKPLARDRRRPEVLPRLLRRADVLLADHVEALAGLVDRIPPVSPGVRAPGRLDTQGDGRRRVEPLLDERRGRGRLLDARERLAVRFERGVEPRAAALVRLRK